MAVTTDKIIALRARGLTRRQIAAETGLSYNAVKKRLWRAGDKILVDDCKFVTPTTPTVAPEQPLPDLSSLNDRERWRTDLRDLLGSKDVAVVMHPCDRHRPFEDKVADEMWYTLAALAKPDIVVRGSDEDDLPTISKFALAGAPTPEIGDFLDVQYLSRRYHTRRTKLVVPSALQVNIEGNHGWPRFIRWVNTQAQHAKTTLLRRYIENIRCDSGVYWIGAKQGVRIGKPLLVIHGKKAGLHAAKATLDMRHSSVSIMAGHTHRPDMYSVVSTAPVTAVISGCLCLIPQDYNDDDDDSYSTWQHGTAVATMDIKSGLVDIKEVRFHRADNRAWFEWGGKLYVFDVAAINGEEKQEVKAA